MAEVLEQHDFGAAVHGNAKYPWPAWTDGSTWRIKQGVDFDVEPHVMQGQIKVRAGKESRKAVTSVSGDTVVFTFQRLDESLEEFAARTNADLGNFSDRLLETLREDDEKRTVPELAEILGADLARTSRTLTYLASRKGRHRVERFERSDGAIVWAAAPIAP